MIIQVHCGQTTEMWWAKAESCMVFLFVKSKGALNLSLTVPIPLMANRNLAPRTFALLETSLCKTYFKLFLLPDPFHFFFDIRYGVFSTTYIRWITSVKEEADCKSIVNLGRFCSYSRKKQSICNEWNTWQTRFFKNNHFSVSMYPYENSIHCFMFLEYTRTFCKL